jgi:hypothetical protein
LRANHPGGGPRLRLVFGHHRASQQASAAHRITFPTVVGSGGPNSFTLGSMITWLNLTPNNGDGESITPLSSASRLIAYNDPPLRRGPAPRRSGSSIWGFLGRLRECQPTSADSIVGLQPSGIGLLSLV